MKLPLYWHYLEPDCLRFLFGLVKGIYIIQIIGDLVVNEPIPLNALPIVKKYGFATFQDKFVVMTIIWGIRGLLKKLW
jgi:hypothetical protein